MDPDVPVKTSVPVVILGEKSPGVKRIEVISHSLNKWTKVMLFVGIFLIAYAYGLDGSVRYVYQVLSIYPSRIRFCSHSFRLRLLARMLHTPF